MINLRKYLISIHKETLLLIRDIEGIVLIFVMPLILVVVMTLLQHRTFQNISEKKIPVIVVNFDRDSLGAAFTKGIRESGVFEVTEAGGGDTALLQEAKRQVAEGKYQIGVIIPAGATRAIIGRAVSLIGKQLPEAMRSTFADQPGQSAITVFYDPITKESFRGLTRVTLEKFAATTESRIFISAYSKVLDAITGQQSEVVPPDTPCIVFHEDMVSEYTGGVMPNAVQHNVPAWTLFGMFLICIPAAGSMIRERTEGCMARLKTLPVGFLNIILPKTLVFVVICLLQALVIFLAGVYAMPLFGLPALQAGGSFGALCLVTLASAMAASGFGIAIGSVASTFVQASTFGSVSTVILAAVGGVWVPVMAMGPVMRSISAFSPLNWGVTGYYDVFLRSASLIDVLPVAMKLFAFFAVCMGAGWLLKKG